MRELQTAVVGCGIAGSQIHVPVVEAHPDLELVAVCDADESRLRSVDVDADVSRYTDLDELLAAESLDSVHVCTPPHTHVAVAEPVLEAGIPVLVEKPAADSVEAVDELARISEETGTTASVVHNKLFTPFVTKARRKVDRGEIGDPVSVTMLFGEPRDLSLSDRGDWVFGLPGGEIGEGIAHQAYLPLAFVDGLGEVSCVTTQNYGGYDDVSFDGVALEALDGSGDRLVTIKVLTGSTSKDQLLVHGRNAELTIDFIRGGLFTDRVANEDNSVGVLDFLRSNAGLGLGATRNVVGKVGERLAELYDARVNDEPPIPNRSHYEQIDAHQRALREGRAPPVTLDEARDTVRILEALGEAASAEQAPTVGDGGTDRHD
ncbi:Gfo/Idh/MocA family protein [Haloarchaeobius baliensis]|uniref:Gfo/Idh/MocA family protein n=1 Tax=Haloarchaeobius baliensis TaxID=1670458 RepID=UPI003F881033